jgi:hypothetical protein
MSSVDHLECCYLYAYIQNTIFIFRR